MEIRVGKKAGYLPDETIQKCINLLARGVERRLKDAPFAFDLKGPWRARKFGISDQPTGSVTGNIELGNHPDATLRSVSHHPPYFGLRIELSVGTQLLEL